MTRHLRPSLATVALVVVALTGSGCATSDRSGENASAPTTSATPATPILTIQDYIADNGITETAVRVTDTTAPRVDLPLPPGWADAGPNTPEWSLGAIIYSTPTDPANPPNIIAVMSKLTGDVDPAKIVEYAPGEMTNQTGFVPIGQPRRLRISGFEAAQSAGSYVKNSMKRAIIQTTVAIPAPDGVYALQMNADAPDGEQTVLAEATRVIDEKTAITLR